MAITIPTPVKVRSTKDAKISVGRPAYISRKGNKFGFSKKMVETLELDSHMLQLMSGTNDDTGEIEDVLFIRHSDQAEVSTRCLFRRTKRLKEGSSKSAAIVSSDLAECLDEIGLTSNKLKVVEYPNEDGQDVFKLVDFDYIAPSNEEVINEDVEEVEAEELEVDSIEFVESVNEA